MTIRRSFCNFVLFLFLFFSLIIILSSGFVNAFAGGDGSIGNPYQISNCQELQAINDGFVGSEYSKYNQNYYVLINDIDCSETKTWRFSSSLKGFVPIGFPADQRSFLGGLNGNGYRVYNLYSEHESNSIAYGFFARLGLDARLSNIHLVNSTIIASYEFKVGGLVGENGGEIVNCSFEGSVFGKKIIGGLVGLSWGRITNSYSIAKVYGVDPYGRVTTGIGLVYGGSGNISESACYSASSYPGSCCFSSQDWRDCFKVTDITRFNRSFCSSLGGRVCASNEHCSIPTSDESMQTGCCLGECLLNSCSESKGNVCAFNEYCSGNIVGSINGSCCIGTCVQKTCSQLGGDVCASDEVCSGYELTGSSQSNCCSEQCVKESESDLTCESCNSCGAGGLFNVCDEDECKNKCALNEENGCVFTPRIVGGSCISTPIILVTECGVLNESGAIYKLQNDIYFKPYMPEFIDKTGGYCFYVIGDNITLDLNGYKISGNVFLEEDYEGIFCGGFGPDYSYACETSIFSSGEYDLLDFLFFSNYWGTESEEYNPQTPYYMHPPVGFGGVVVGGSNFELRRGIIDSFYNVGVYYNYEGKGESSNLIKDIGFDQTDVLVESRDSKIVLDIENSVFGQGPYIFDSSPGSYWADPVSDLYSSAVYQTFPVDLSFKNVSFDSMYSAVYLENTNLFVPYNFFSQNDNLPNNFYFNPSWGMSLGGNLSFVDNVRDPKISFTLINPTMESYDSSVLKNSIRFDGNVFDVFNERINFTAFPGLDVPTHVVNKNLFYNPPPKNYVFRFNLPDGGFIKIPSNFSFFENVSFNPYINFIYKGLEFCNSTVYLHCSGGKGCNAATYRCN